MEQINRIIVILVMMGSLTACSESSVAQKSNGSLGRKTPVVPDSLVVGLLGEEVSQVLFSPSKAVCYQMAPTFGGDNSDNDYFLKAERTKVGDMERVHQVPLQLILADIANYNLDSSEEPKCFFSPYLAFEFTGNNKNVVTLYISFNCEKFAFEQNGKVVFYKYGCQSSLVRYCHWLLPKDAYLGALKGVMENGGKIPVKGTFHAIVVADVNDPSIGEMSLLDSYIMEIEMQTIAAAIDYSIEKHLLQGDGFSLVNVEKALKELKCGENDIVFFYFTGKGGRESTDKSPFPRMVFGSSLKETMPLDLAERMISSKSPRFAVVMADCGHEVFGNSVNKETPLTNNQPQTGITRIGEELVNHYKTMFVDQRGSVTVCAASQGCRAWCNQDGGLFTHLFVRYMDSVDLDDWNVLLEKVKQQSTSMGQTPFYEIRQ